MKLVKSLLLGSAAGLTAVAGAQAADLPVQKAAPVEYVRVCTFAGTGFFYIPGTDTCLKVGGRVRAEYLYQETFDRRENSIGFLARGRIELDARNQTDYGTLRAFVRYELTRTTGAYRTGGGPIGDNGDPSQESLSGGNFTGVNTVLDRAFIQFGGLTAGRIASFFDFYANAFAFSAALGSDRSTQLLAYTANFGNGFSATLSMEDGIERRVFGGLNLFTVDGLATGNPGFTRGGVFFPSSRLAIGGETAPDGVANIRYDNSAFGSAQISAAVHQVRSANFEPLLNRPVGTRQDVVDTEYGYAVQGGVKINLPFIAAGDVLYLQAAYAEGAINYLGFGGASTSLGALSPLNLTQTDAFVNPAGDLELTEGFSVVGAFLHYFTPQLRGAIIGSYGQLDYNRAGTGTITATSPIGAAFPRLRGGRFGFVDTEEFRVEGNLIYSPVKDLDFGVDILYQNIDPKGRVLGFERGAGGAVARLVNSEDIIIGRLRIQRDF